MRIYSRRETAISFPSPWNCLDASRLYEVLLHGEEDKADVEIYDYIYDHTGNHITADDVVYHTLE
jgi:hypothetical protein